MSNGDQIVDQFFYPQSVTVGEAVEVRGRVSPPGQLGDLVCVIPTRYDLQGLPITATPLITRPDYSTGEYSVTFTPTRAADWEVLTRWVYDFDGNPTASDCLDPSFVLADSSAQPPLSPPTVPVSEGKSTIQLSSTGDLGRVLVTGLRLLFSYRLIPASFLVPLKSWMPMVPIFKMGSLRQIVRGPIRPRCNSRTKELLR